MTSQEPEVITLTKYRNWYVVTDSKSYDILHSISLPFPLFDQSTFDLMRKLLTRSRIRAEVEEWIDVYNVFLEKAKTRFADRIVFSQEKSSRFAIPFSSDEELEKCKSTINNWLNRYSFRADYEIRRRKGKKDLKVIVSFDPDLSREKYLGKDHRSQSAEVRFGNQVAIQATVSSTPVKHLNFRLLSIEGGEPNGLIFARDLVIDPKATDQKEELRKMAAVLFRLSL